MATELFNYLESNMYFSRSSHPQAALSYRWSELLEAGPARQLVEQYAPAIRAFDLDAAATYFCSWFGGVCAALQYMISHHDAAFHLTPDNLTVQMYMKDGKPFFAFWLHDRVRVSVPSASRTAWRNRVLTQFYAEGVRPLLGSIAKASGLPVGQLWGMLATRLHYVNEMWVQAAADEESARVQIEEDFAALLQLDPGVFGTSKNPLNVKFRYIENPCNPSEKWRIKASCCLAYRTDTDHGYCYNCPRVSATEREAMKEQLLAASTS